jgi:oligopeptide transport system ATP-binding protein
VNLLLELQNELGLALIFITHDLRLVHHIAHRIAVMYLGSIMDIGPTEDIFASARHPYTRALLAAVPRLVPGRRSGATAVQGELPSPLAPPPGCPFHPRCPMAQAICRQEVPELELRGGHWPAACHFAGPVEAPADLSRQDISLP